MNFAAPERLSWVIGALSVIVVVALAARRRRGATWGAASLVLRAALVAAVGVALLEPIAAEKTRRRPRVDVVLDASRSVGEESRGLVVATARRLAAEGEADVRLLRFGAGLLSIETLGAAVPESAPAPAPASFASDPHEALAAALLEPADGGARLLLATDGRTPPPRVDAREFRDRSPIIVPLGPRLPRGVRVDALVPKPSAGDGADAVVELRGVSDLRVDIVVRVFVDGTETRAYPLSLPSGAFVETLPLGVLPPGRRLLLARVESPPGADAEPLDDETACVFRVPEPPVILCVSEDANPLVASALRVQGLAVERLAPAEFARDVGRLDRAGAVVLDRVPVALLSEPTLLAAIENFVRRGGGLWFLPRDRETAKNELAPRAEAAFLELLPFVGVEELDPKPEEPKPEPPKPDTPGIKPPEPEKKTIERREAPTLGLLLLIDASGSMRGQKLRLAQIAAVKAAETLHAADRIGVVAFNDFTIEVVPMSPAADLDFVRDQVSRIQAGGGTDFRVALEAAREIFGAERLQVKHCILVSDGFSNTKGAFSKLARELRSEGVTVSTVGVGVDSDVEALSNIAAEGGGKFQAAPDVNEIPQVFAVEAERIIAKFGARRRDEPPPAPDVPPPPPSDPSPSSPDARPPTRDPSAPPPPRRAIGLRAAWPAPYLKGVRPETTEGIFARHKAEPTRAAWPAIRTETGDLVVAHGYLGFGRIVAQTAAIEGPSSGTFALWEDLPNFAAQVIRFLLPGAPPERFVVAASSSGREIELTIEDAEGKPEPPGGWTVEARDALDRRLDLRWIREGGVLRSRLPDDDPSNFVEVRVSSSSGPGTGRGAAQVGRAAEIESIGVDRAALKAWAEALGGTTTESPTETIALPRVEVERRVPSPPPWLPWIAAALLLDLLLKRLVPGDVPPRRRRTA